MKLKKNILKRASILAVSGVVVGSMIVGSITSSVEAATRLYGVQQIVEGLADGTDTFDILEIVPDYSDASMGFYGDGGDVIIDSRFLTAADRQEAIETLLASINGTHLSAKLVSYQEQLYQPENMTGWQILDKTDETDRYYEERTGSFVLASDQGVSQGDYFLSPKLTLSLNLVDDDGNIQDLEKASYKAGDDVTIRLSVESGRMSDEESDTELPATITIFAGTDGNAVDLVENLGSSDSGWNSDTHSFSIADIVNLGKQSYDFTYTIPTDNTGVSFILSAEAVVSGGTTADSGTYNSNLLEFVMGSTTSQKETSEAASTTETSEVADSTETSVTETSEVTGSTETSVTETSEITGSTETSVTETSEATSSTEASENAGTTESTVESSASSEGDSETPTDQETGSTENTTYQTEEINSIEVEQVYNHSDFIYSEDGGSYIWVDKNENEDGGYKADVPVGKIYYKTEIRCNNMFATHILELVGKTGDAENDDAAIQKIHVHTYTPADLEKALSANELALNGMDLVYVSNSGILQGGGFDRASYKDVDTTTGTYVNDLSWDTVFNIYEYAVNTNLPVILDHSIMQDNGTDDQKAADQSTMLKGDGTTDSGNNILRLSYLFRNYVMTGEKAVEEAETSAIWTESFVKNIVGTKELSYGTYGLVHNSIFINMDENTVSVNDGTNSGTGTQFIGNLVCDTISDSIFVYESTEDDNAEGETVVTGMTNIVNEISNDNFYNNTNGNEYTVEYVEAEDGEITVTVSRATLVKYILNYNLRRVTLYKDTIRVLDLEPTKYSTLSEDDIRGWLGIESGSYSVEVTDSDSTTLRFDNSNMTVTSEKGENNHSWYSSNNNVITVSGDNRTGKLTLVGAGTVTIEHKYRVYWFKDYYYEESEYITLKVTANEASESHVKEITIDQYSTSEFIGKLDDLIETYDMIYIGDCIGPQYADGSLYQEYGKTKYNDSALNGKIYLHVGDLVETMDLSLRGLLDVDETWSEKVSTRYSGNDITEDKYQELLEYAQAGYPIVVSSKFYDGKTVSDTYLDNSSYIYKLINAVANGFDATKTLTEEEALKKFGTEEAAVSNGYKKTVFTSYSKEVTTTLKKKLLTKVKNFSELDANGSYIIANANTQSGYAYKVIDTDLTMKGDLKTTLNGVDSVTVSASAVKDSFLWTLKNDGNNGYYDMVTCYLQNSEGKYLTISKCNNEFGATLQNLQTGIQLFKGNEYISNSFAFGNYINNYQEKGDGYLNARTYAGTDRAGSYTVKDFGSSWYIYKVTDAPDETLTSRESITAAEYQAAETQYGSENMEAKGYYKSELITYTYTEYLSGVPNVMPDNDTKTAINKLVKYINMPRLNLVMVKTPTPYTSTADKYTGELTGARWLESEGGKYYLKYEFEFANTAEATAGQSTYTLQLYVDVNADGRYVPTEELDGIEVYEAATLKSVPANQLSSGVRYTASRELPQGYVGMLPWKFVISMNTGSTNELTTVRSSEIGYTAIKNTSTQATEIRVLQILPSEGALNLKTDSTFSSLFDSVKEKMNYNLDIEPKTVEAVENEYKSGKYTDSADFYEKFLKQYDMLIWGYADVYGYQDFSEDVIKAFGLFIDSGKATLFSHDLTSFNNGYYGHAVFEESGWGYHMNRYLRSVAGMDRFGITESSLDFLKEKTHDYDLTEEEEAKIQVTKKDVASKDTSESTGDTYYLAQGFANGFLTYFKDAYNDILKLQGDTYRANKFEQTTTSINQTNEGQITLYPFDITIAETVSEGSSETWTKKRSQYSGDSSYYVEELAKMKIEDTHYQYYQLDFNYDTDNDGTNNLVVWYTLAGGDYDNVPNDVRNDYYIYSVGNVTYTGMGHTSATTLEEAQLFVNTIIAAYNAGNKNPGVTIVQDIDNKNSSIDYIYRTFDETSPSDNNQDESFAFYVDDTNMIQGTKTIEVWYYYEIGKGDYDDALKSCGSVTAANAAGYYEVNADTSEPVYLKAYSSDTSASDYIGKVFSVSALSEKELSEKAITVENKTAVQVTVESDWINQRLVNASEGNATIWIGALTKLDYDAVNKATEYTDRVFDCVTFKKRNLTNLD